MSAVDAEKLGLKAALQELHDPAAPVPGAIDGEQLALPALPLEGAETTEPAARGKGRPPGAKNKNTEAWRDFILSQYRSPLEALAQTYSMSLQQLADRMRQLCGWQSDHRLTFDQVLDLLKLQLQAAKELAPYVHQKMPLALEAGENGLIQLVMNVNQQAAAAGPAAQPIVLEALKTTEENQLLAPHDLENSNQPNSNQQPQGADNE